MDESAKCFGSYEPSDSRCQNCVYGVSCSYYRSTASSVESRLRLTSLDNLAPWSKALIDPNADIPGENMPEDLACEPDPAEELVSIRELTRFFRYLMQLDRYTIAVLRELLDSPSDDPCTISKLSRRFGVTRQAVYRKILRIARKHPELRYVLRGTFTRMLPRHTV